ncbi:MAG TPA: sigma-70 family RNA polymerase sigma factor, partial [Streptosporangiaceae bacterium]|nr:sigma-70 family RNA polymerase sigma factor [Streptosporangiaceae bacterium]
LRQPDRLRSWLYAVARNECHRRLRAGSQHASIEEAPDVTDEAVDVAADVERADLRALVRDALGGVGPTEREILELQLRQGLSGAEVASVLGISRNHAHALLSRARDHLETSLGALVVARTGRQDCPELDAMLRDWDGALTVLIRKRLNRHVERCDVCSGRRRRAVSPAMLLGIAPIAALPLLAGGLPAGFRDQVLRLATGHSSAAVAHRAAVAKTSYSFGHHGFPRPLHQPGPPWLHPRPAHAGAVAGTVAAVAAGVTLIAPPPHPGVPPAGPATPGVTGRADPGRGGQPGTPGTSATARPGALPAAIGGSGAGRPDAGVMAVLPSAGASGAGVTVGPSVSASPSVSTSTSDAPGAGTLSVSPSTLDIAPPASGTITLSASGGTVNWSVSEPAGLGKKVVVAPMSGTLAAGQTAAISVTVPGPGKPRVHLRFSPDGAIVTVVIS